MSVMTVLECDVCHIRSAEVGEWIEITEVVVTRMLNPNAHGPYIINENGIDLPRPHVCGQGCYHKWHAKKLAEFYDPSQREREQVAAMVEKHEAGYGQVAIEGAAVGVER